VITSKRNFDARPLAAPQQGAPPTQTVLASPPPVKDRFVFSFLPMTLTHPRREPRVQPYTWVVDPAACIMSSGKRGLTNPSSGFSFALRVATELC
jgi:hypothetical protein